MFAFNEKVARVLGQALSVVVKRRCSKANLQTLRRLLTNAISPQHHLQARPQHSKSKRLSCDM
jgi:hypothetical protein